jgi:hypothetical protein
MASVTSCVNTRVQTTNKVIPCEATDLVILNESAFNLLDEKALNNVYIVNNAWEIYCK